MDFESIMLAGVPALILIPKLVNLCKSYGFPDRYIPLLCIGLAVGVVFLADWTSRNTNVEWAVTLTVTGVLLGLLIAGDRAFNTFYERKADERQLQDTAVEDQTKTEITTTATPEMVVTEQTVSPAEPVAPVVIPPTVTAGGTPEGGKL